MSHEALRALATHPLEQLVGRDAERSTYVLEAVNKEVSGKCRGSVYRSTYVLEVAAREAFA